jgi:hypothetical protein
VLNPKNRSAGGEAPLRWRGGPEAIRQNSIFKDVFQLAQSESAKRKYLYLLGTEYPLKSRPG